MQSCNVLDPCQEHKTSKPRPVVDASSQFQRKILLYAGIQPITELKKGHTTNVIGWIPALSKI